MRFQADTKCKCTVQPAFNFGDRAEHLSIDILLLHYTGMETGEAALDWLCREESGVSCHYLVFEDGRIVQMVREEKRAWHAGKSSWQGEVDTNSRSIGIEIVNPGHSGAYPDFPDVQIKSVIELCRDILKRNQNILPKNVLAHSDVAPGRKHDPGEKFPWKLLYEQGIGHWASSDISISETTQNVDQCCIEVSKLQAMLFEYGYGVDISGIYCSKTRDCVFAFQQHFRQNKVDGIADEQTVSVLEGLMSIVS